jgi:molybdate transport system substrate-binding protein
MRRTALALTVVATAGLLLAGCGSSSTPSASPATTSTTTSSAPDLSGTINVLAAASLQEAFTTLGKQFEAAHPGTKVVFNFGPSSGLATQINQGAPADVFASASTKNMDQVAKAAGATSPTNFASNVMEIAVPVTNPAGVNGLSDLAKPAVKWPYARSRSRAAQRPQKSSRTRRSP